MLDDKDLLELCLSISGAFESGGAPSYTTTTGNFDGMGMSVGVLQWNAGQGTMQYLLQRIGKKMGWDKAKSFFKSDIQYLSTLTGPHIQDAIKFCLDHYIAEGSTKVDPAAAKAWQKFLSQPESVEAQIELASEGPLSHAKELVVQFCPDFEDSTRSHAFFFDLVVQSGGMRNKRGKVDPVASVKESDWQPALTLAHQKSEKCAGIWELVLQNDEEAQLLVYYAHKRSLLSNPPYVWDALSRRGSIACRGGFVHGAIVNFMDKLD